MWSGSTTDEVRFVPVSKRNARVWYQKARSWDRRSKAKGKHGGGIGLLAMAVLHAFHFDFLNYVTGRLDPSYDGIARMTGLARSTVATAIARLRRLGIINWVRRGPLCHCVPGPGTQTRPSPWSARNLATMWGFSRWHNRCWWR